MFSMFGKTPETPTETKASASGRVIAHHVTGRVA